MTIDSHQHFWTYDPENYAWITDDMANIRRDFGPNDLLPLLQEHGLDGCVVVQTNQTEQENYDLVQLSKQHPFIKGVVGWTNLFSGKLEERLQEYKNLDTLKGFRHVVQAEPVGFMKNEYFIKAINTLGKHGFTYDVLIYPTQLKDAVHLAENCTQTTLIVDHIAKPYIKDQKITQWANYIKKLAEYPNVYCKVSGMVTEAHFEHWKKEDFYIYLDIVLNSFGVDRLLYGSDWPVCLAAATYAEQLDIVQSYFAELSENEKDKIFGGNACKVYSL